MLRILHIKKARVDLGVGGGGGVAGGRKRGVGEVVGRWWGGGGGIVQRAKVADTILSVRSASNEGASKARGEIGEQERLVSSILRPSNSPERGVLTFNFVLPLPPCIFT